MQRVYLSLAVVGTLVPYWPFVRWLGEQRIDGATPARFLEELFSTRIGAFFGLDVMLSAVTLFVFMAAERGIGRRIRTWTAVVGTLLVGGSLGLPLYLYERERARVAQRPVSS